VRETWLKPNRRALLFGCVPPLLLGAFGALNAATANRATDNWRYWLGMGSVVVALVLLAMLIRHLLRPRIAYRDGQVLFYLHSGAPIEVPADVVEAFFLGQGPATLPGGIHNRQQTVNLVARLAQRRSDWAARDVKPALGDWADGYVTIRGTWCEPLDAELVRRLNRRLHEVQTAIHHTSDEA
jgi:hypothetical protein